MNSWKIGVNNLRDIAKAATSPDHSYADECGLYSAARIILDDLEKHVVEQLGHKDGYISEKIGKVKWHIGAMLDFDVDNGHDTQEHLVWAYGALNTLEDLLKERFPDD
jgi:hypothetical protein